MSTIAKIILLCCVGITVIAGSIFVALHYADTLEDCTLEYPLACSDQQINASGFTIIFANNANTPLYIRDVTVSMAGKERCHFPRNVTGKGDAVLSHRALMYLITPDHPDGKCLMQDMIPGKTYKIDLEVEYMQNKVNATARGHGRVFVEKITPKEDE